VATSPGTRTSGHLHAGTLELDAAALGGLAVRVTLPRSG